MYAAYIAYFNFKLIFYVGAGESGKSTIVKQMKYVNSLLFFSPFCKQHVVTNLEIKYFKLMYMYTKHNSKKQSLCF